MQKAYLYNPALWECERVPEFACSFLYSCLCGAEIERWNTESVVAIWIEAWQFLENVLRLQIAVNLEDSKRGMSAVFRAGDRAPSTHFCNNCQ